MNKRTESIRRNALLKRFGTTDILEILGPAGTIPPTQSLHERLIEFGVPSANTNKWVASYVPEDLYAQLKPYQRKLGSLKAAATNIKKYGCSNPFGNEDIKAKIRVTNIAKYGSACSMNNAVIRAKRDATNLERYGHINPFGSSIIRSRIVENNLKKYGGHPLSLPPDEIMHRLSLYDLEPLIPITCNSDSLREIPARCKLCGREFITHWNQSNSRGYNGIGLISCGCEHIKSRLERYLLETLSLEYPSVTSMRPDWMPSLNGGQNLEVDIYFPELRVGIELNGYACHNTESGINDASPKAPNYHKYKSDCCLRNGVKLYHYWYDHDTPLERIKAIYFIKSAIADGWGCKPLPGDKIDRDVYPDPAEAGLPYKELPPEPFDSPDGICYNSGYWLFLEPNEE